MSTWVLELHFEIENNPFRDPNPAVYECSREADFAGGCGLKLQKSEFPRSKPAFHKENVYQEIRVFYDSSDRVPYLI